ncbi:cardiolipin synthase [Buchnera aphidicola (Pemphigus obesinymphae)]|uniref:cardiolipin synthase n=1 Tax=Buchnera aphidicola TaxID=9 RepID=UPI002238B7CE|nr:cardiolipin synthase [Buchnera aphidicola]MCW5196508.1 cardiolipin synthase [Buchnera aphidicola (Pemphigus obesinymphae)]
MTTLYISLFTWLFFFGYWIILISITYQILTKRHSTPAAIAWFLIIYIFPIIGIITWLFFGKLYLSERRFQLANKIWSKTNVWLTDFKSCETFFEKKNSDVATSLFQLCKHRQGISGIKCDQLKLLTNAKEIIKTLIHDIYLAKNNIEMVFYIWKPGGLADDVANALISSAKRGIHCRLMLDSAGSVDFFRSKWAQIMRNSGIQVVEALKINIFRIFIRRIDLRQHRKVILIDNYITYTGSMNLVDPRLFKQSAGVGQWIDLMARIEGPIASTVGIIYSCDWEIETGKKILPKTPKKNKNFLKLKKKHNSIQVIASGPGFPKNMIHQALLTAIYSARKELIITTPYLVPSDDVLHAICTAAQRGIKVSIIIPRYNDSLLVKWASRAFFSELLDAGVKIYLFEKGLLHSKSILVDQQLSLIGTANLDMRSLWLNFEITLVIDNSQFGKDLASIQYEYISHSRLLDKKLWSIRSHWKIILENFFYFFNPLL